MASINSDADTTAQERFQDFSQEAMLYSFKYEVGSILYEYWMLYMWDTVAKGPNIYFTEHNM